MKKIAILSVLATYLVLNLGISMKFHYCGDTISFIDFFPVTSKTCCGGNKKPACCKDKITRISQETTQDNIQIVSFLFPDYAKFNLPIQDFSFLSNLESEKTDINISVHTRENFHLKVPLYLRNRVLIL